MGKLVNYIQEKGFTFSATSKAAKLLKGKDVDESALALALATTKPYKTDKALQDLCSEVLSEGLEKKEPAAEPKRSSTSRSGERTRY